MTVVNFNKTNPFSLFTDYEASAIIDKTLKK